MSSDLGLESSLTQYLSLKVSCVTAGTVVHFFTHTLSSLSARGSSESSGCLLPRCWLSCSRRPWLSIFLSPIQSYYARKCTFTFFFSSPAHLFDLGSFTLPLGFGEVNVAPRWFTDDDRAFHHNVSFCVRHNKVIKLFYNQPRTSHRKIIILYFSANHWEEHICTTPPSCKFTIRCLNVTSWQSVSYSDVIEMWGFGFKQKNVTWILWINTNVWNVTYTSVRPRPPLI